MAAVAHASAGVKPHRGFRLLLATALALLSCAAAAHGERAQMPQLRMSTVHWFDIALSTTRLDVNDEITIKGSFMPSRHWPEHVESIEKNTATNY